MAHPPPARPQAAPAPDQAALDEARAQQLEQHVDAWIRGQPSGLDGLTAPARFEVSIGERDSIRPEVLALVCARYIKAGWTKTTVSQDLTEEFQDELGNVVSKLTKPDPRGIVLKLVC